MSTSEIKILTFIMKLSADDRVCSFFRESAAQCLLLFSKFSNNYITVENSVKQNDISNNSTRGLTSNLLNNGERGEIF